DAIPLMTNTSFTKARKNYITPEGLQRLKDEHRFLLTRERPAVTAVVAWAASNGDRSENADYQYGKRRLREIDRRVRFIRKRLEKVQVVDPAAQTKRRAVYFGATVTYVRAVRSSGAGQDSAGLAWDDREVTITIV